MAEYLRTGRPPLKLGTAVLVVLVGVGLGVKLVAQRPPFKSSETEHERILRLRSEWFYRQRAYPFGRVNAAGRLSALAELRAMVEREATQPRLNLGPLIAGPWVSIGPQPTNTPYNVTPTAGRVTALVVDPRNPNVAFLGAAMGGVWKTTDGGTTWTPLTDTQASLATGSIALDPSNPDIVYVGTGEANFAGDNYYGAGVLKSTDGGATWTQLPGPFVGPIGPDPFFSGGAHIAAIAVHPTNGQIVLAAIHFFTRDGIYRSTDGGVNWMQVLPGARATAVFFDPTGSNVAYAALGENFGSPNNGVYKSTDGGATWARVPGAGFPTANVGRIALAGAPSSPSTLYAGVHNTADGTLLGFFSSSDAGATWTRLINTPNYCDTQCWYDNVIAVHPTNPNLVFAGGAFQSVLWRSSDGGTSWTNVSGGADGFFLHADMHALAFSNTGSLYVGNDGGAYVGLDPTATPVAWTNLNGTLSITQFYAGHSIDPTNVMNALGGTQDNGTQHYTGQMAWDNVTCGDGGWTAIDFVNPQTLYATCQLIFIQKSVSGGAFGTWNLAQNGINTSDRVQFIPPFVIDPSDPLTLYFGTFRVYQTRNGASSWQTISPDLTGGSDTLTTIAVAPSDSNTVYAGISNSRVQVTTNATDASPVWSNVSAGLPPRFITQVAVDPIISTTAYVTVSGFSGFFGDTQGHVFKTTNGGAAWTDISGNLPNIPANDLVIDPDIPNTLYLATDIGVFASSDGGTSWSTFTNGLPRVAALGLKLDRGSRTLRAATHGRGMYDASVPVPPLSATALAHWRTGQPSH